MSNFSDVAAGLNESVASAFGTACTYTPPGGVGFAVTLVLEKPTAEDTAFPGAYLKASGVLADFTTPPAKAGRVTVGSDIYIVFADPEDEEGMVTLALNKI